MMLCDSGWMEWGLSRFKRRSGGLLLVVRKEKTAKYADLVISDALRGVLKL